MPIPMPGPWPSKPVLTGNSEVQHRQNTYRGGGGMGVEKKHSVCITLTYHNVPALHGSSLISMNHRSNSNKSLNITLICSQQKFCSHIREKMGKKYCQSWWVWYGIFSNILWQGMGARTWGGCSGRGLGLALLQGVEKLLNLVREVRLFDQVLSRLAARRALKAGRGMVSFQCIWV